VKPFPQSTIKDSIRSRETRKQEFVAATTQFSQAIDAARALQINQQFIHSAAIAAMDLRDEVVDSADQMGIAMRACLAQGDEPAQSIRQLESLQKEAKDKSYALEKYAVEVKRLKRELDDLREEEDEEDFGSDIPEKTEEYERELKELRDTQKAKKDLGTEIRRAIDRLVQLAVGRNTGPEGALECTNFPELRLHSHVQDFLESGGLEADEVGWADFEIEGELAPGRNTLLKAKYGDKTVCLKKFKVIGDDPNGLQMREYRREIKTVSQLKHLYIIQYQASFLHEQSMYLMMDFYKNGSLKDWLRKEPKPSQEKRRQILIKVLKGLDCIHRHGIVHRDLKPDNVLIGDDLNPRICDFETSKNVGGTTTLGGGATTTVGGGRVGTNGFMAPELNRLDARDPTTEELKQTDMYSFGMLILNTVYDIPQGEAYPAVDYQRAVQVQVAPTLGHDNVLKNLLNREQPERRPSTELLLQADYFTGSLDAFGRVQTGDYVSTKSCRDELLEAGRNPALGVSLDEVRTVVRRIDQKMREQGLDGETDTVKDHRFAFFIYSTESNIYKKLNSALRARSGPAFDAWVPYLWHLSQALQALPDVATTVYRGMDAPNLAEYQQSKRIHWSGFTSTSTDASVSNHPPFYNGPPGVVFKLTVQNAKDIQPYSALPQEAELLLSPNMEFLVTEELHEPSEGPLRGCRVIEMQQIPDDTLWS
jgi:serine/threonine protein kinase